MSDADLTDQMIIAQKEELEKEIADTSDLVGPFEEISVLKAEFANDDVFKAKANNLSLNYSGFRRIRPDGNCFFRAVAYRYLEVLLTNKDELKRFRDQILPSKDEMFSLGFPKMTVEDFYENFIETIDKVDNVFDANSLLDEFNNQGTSDYLVVFMRLLTSLHLKKNAEFFQNFIENGKTIEEFCATEVEPMYIESDNIHVIALTSITGLNIRIMYFDRGNNTEASPHDFPEGSQPLVHLLYRPGHYDVLYTKN